LLGAYSTTNHLMPCFFFIFKFHYYKVNLVCFVASCWLVHFVTVLAVSFTRRPQEMSLILFSLISNLF
jgi:hypothetical protein